MAYTLLDFLQSEIVPEIKLVTKSIDFSKIPVANISVQEAIFKTFIHDGEIILSTALGCEYSPERFLDMIKILKGTPTAAVLFAFKDEKMMVPPAVVEFANEISLPIFVIPWKYHFSDIQKALFKAIQAKELSLYQSIQNTLINLFFELHPLDDAAYHIGKLFNCYVEILDDLENVLGKSKVGTNHTQEVDSVSLFDIKINGSFVGQLKIYSDALSVEDEKQVDIYEKYLIFPLSLWFNRREIENITETRLKNDFVWNLAHGNFTSLKEMIRQGHLLGFDLNLPYICIAMTAIIDKPSSDILEYSSKVSQNALNFERILLQEGKARRFRIMVSNVSLDFVVFLERKNGFSLNDVNSYIDSVEEKITSVFPQVTCHWGISDIDSGESDFHSLYKNASLALKYCVNDYSGRKRLTYKDTKKALITSSLCALPVVQQNAKETLQKLLDYDSTSDINLLRTLTEYIRSNYAVSQTARNLHIHRQSLLYRLEKIEMLTGMDLNNHDDLFVLEVFSRVYVSY